MDSGNHYEVAFASYLLEQKLCYIAVDEGRRSLADDAPIKSLDFMVLGAEGQRLVVDVKGRRFPAGPPSRPRRVWECWAFREDVEGLQRWAAMAGPDYRGLLVFAYALHPTVELSPGTPDLFAFRGRRYLFRAVDVCDYREQMRQRSPRWRTVTLPGSVYRSLVRPLGDFLRPAVAHDVPF